MCDVTPEESAKLLEITAAHVDKTKLMFPGRCGASTHELARHLRDNHPAVYALYVAVLEARHSDVSYRIVTILSRHFDQECFVTAINGGCTLQLNKKPVTEKVTDLSQSFTAPFAVAAA